MGKRLYKTIFLFFVMLSMNGSLTAAAAPKIGIVVSSFNRPEYLSQTLLELQSKSFGKNLDVEIVIIDDCSEQESQQLVDSFHYPDVLVFRVRMQKNSGIAKVLDLGWNLLLNRNCDYLCNIDSDVLLKDNWIEELLKTYNMAKHTLKMRDLIVTGFNTKNHPIKAEYPSFFTKKSIGGINLFFPSKMYKLCVEKSLKANNGWDWELIKICTANNFPLVCTKPSVVQHTGLEGLNSQTQYYDYAEDF